MERSGVEKKVGILGGTFNPIHIGHLMLAQNALEYCELDEVLIIPSGCSYFKDKDEVCEATLRLQMAKLAVEENDRLIVSDIETKRSGNSYTYETFDILCTQNPEYRYYYIIGSDTLFSMETWKRPEDIFSRCTVVCAKRDKICDEEIAAQKKHLEEKFKADIILMDIPEVPVSSSMLRFMMSKGMSCRYYIPDKVLEFIDNNGLYRN